MENKTEKDEILNGLDKTIKTRSRKSKEDFKEKECEIINFDNHTKSLDINFDGYGIRIRNVEFSVNNNLRIKVKYKGEIGKSNFVVKV